MNTFTKLTMAAFILAGLAGCEVDQTQEGEAPEITAEGGQMPEYEQTQEGEMPSVDVQGGQAPRYDVEGPDVDVGTETKEVEMPTVDVDTPEDDDNRTASRDE